MKLRTLCSTANNARRLYDKTAITRLEDCVRLINKERLDVLQKLLTAARHTRLDTGPVHFPTLSFSLHSCASALLPKALALSSSCVLLACCDLQLDSLISDHSASKSVIAGVAGCAGSALHGPRDGGQSSALVLL